MKIWNHKYPQGLWAREVSKILKSNPEMIENKILDAPCGNGIIGHLVQQDHPQIPFILLDNDERLLLSPYAVQSNKTEILVDDIFTYQMKGESNTWLLINSLYCLPNSDELINGKKANFKYIVAIFPDINRSNFKSFTRQNPNFSNESILDLPTTLNFFKQHGYEAINQKSITRIPFHKWNLLFDKLRLPFVLKNLVYLLSEKILFFLSGHYTIIVFKRSE